jgi:cell division transport system permease protein
MSLWFRHHFFSLSSALGRLLGTPLGSVLNILVMGIVLSLPLGMYLLLVNLERVAGHFGDQTQINVFLDRDLASQGVERVQGRLAREPGVLAVEFVPRATALARLAKSRQLSDIVGAMRENPLPDAFVVTLSSAESSVVGPILTVVRSLPGVNHVEADSEWARRLEVLLRLGRTGVILLGVLLSIGLLTVSFNTIRLQIAVLKDEIEISRLVGGTDAYIRRPFLYFGAILGLFGGLVAIGLCVLSVFLVNADVSELAGMLGSQFRLEGLSEWDAFGFLGFAALLGWGGAYLSVSTHILSRY